MDDFIGFMRQASQTPLLAAALIGVAIRDAWMQIALAGVLVSGSAVIWRRWRKKRQSSSMEWHELLAEPVPMPEPHKASDEHTVNCKCTVDPVLALENEDGFCEWYEDRMNDSHILLSETQARRLYDAYQKNRAIILLQRTSGVTE